MTTLLTALQNRFETLDYTHRTIKNAAVLPKAIDYLIAALAGAVLAGYLTLQAAASLAIQFTIRPLDIGDTFKDILPDFESTFTTAKRAAAQTIGVFVSLAGALTSLKGHSQWPLSAQHCLGNFDWKWMKSEAQISRAQAWAHSIDLNAKYQQIDAYVSEAADPKTENLARLSQIAEVCERTLGELRELHGSLRAASGRAQKASSALWERRLQLPSVQNRVETLERTITAIRKKQKHAERKVNNRIHNAYITLLTEQMKANRCVLKINEAARALTRLLDKTLKVKVTSENMEAIAGSCVPVAKAMTRLGELTDSYNLHCTNAWNAWEEAAGKPKPMLMAIDDDKLKLLAEKERQLKERAKIATIYRMIQNLNLILDDAFEVELNPEKAEAIIKACLKATQVQARLYGLIHSYDQHCTQALQAWQKTPDSPKPVFMGIDKAQLDPLAEKVRQLKERAKMAFTYRSARTLNLTLDNTLKLEVNSQIRAHDKRRPVSSGLLRGLHAQQYSSAKNTAPLSNTHPRQAVSTGILRQARKADATVPL